MPTPDLKTMRNATAKKVWSQEGVDPDQDLDIDPDADRGSDADFTSDRDLGSLRKKAAKKALGGEEPSPQQYFEAQRTQQREQEELFKRLMEQADQQTEDTGDTGSDTNWPAGLDTGDTGDTGDRFGGTFGAERIEAVAVGEEWPQEVKDAVHGHREALGEDYELVESIPSIAPDNPFNAKTPDSLLFESPDGGLISVDYNTGEVTPDLERGRLHDYEELRERMIPEWQEELQDVSQQWLDTGDVGDTGDTGG